MSNDNVYERLWKLQTMVNKLVLDGKRDPKLICDQLQSIVNNFGKFRQIADLGTIEVPTDYVHGNRLETFKKSHADSFYDFGGYTADKFQHPSKVLIPGDILRVRIFEQAIPGKTTSEERLQFLSNLDAIFPGLQGMSLTWEFKKDRLPKERFITYLDDRDSLHRDDDGDDRVASICVGDTKSEINYDNFDKTWGEEEAFFCFNMEQSAV